MLRKLFAVQLDWRLADEAIAEDCSEEEKDAAYRESVKCKIFLGFTSNLISSGVRDMVRYLVEHNMVNFAILHESSNFLQLISLICLLFHDC